MAAAKVDSCRFLLLVAQSGAEATAPGKTPSCVAEKTPFLTALCLAELFRQHGLPDGIFFIPCHLLQQFDPFRNANEASIPVIGEAGYSRIADLHEDRAGKSLW